MFIKERFNNQSNSENLYKKSSELKRLKKDQISGTFRLVFNSGMISLALIFAFAAKGITIPFLSQLSLTVDLSTVFLIPIIFISSLRGAIASAIVVSLLHFAWDSANGIGILFILIANTGTVLIFDFGTGLINHTQLRTKKHKGLTIGVFQILSNVLFMTTLNGIIFTPLYGWGWQGISSINFIKVASFYNSNKNMHIYLLGIPDYGTGIWSLFSLFNSLKYGIVAFVSIPTLMFFMYTNTTKVLFN